MPQSRVETRGTVSCYYHVDLYLSLEEHRELAYMDGSNLSHWRQVIAWTPPVFFESQQAGTSL
jgi:hypothetical protein